MKVLHIHETIAIRGGSEVYIDLLCKYLPQYGVQTDWISMYREGEEYLLDNRQRPGTRVKRELLKAVLAALLDESNYSLIHLHGISDPYIVETCLALRPVVRSLHEPRVICPGAQKFFRKSEQVCTIPFGLHCFGHAYTQGCCNRHPARLWQAYTNTYFELNTAAPQYKSLIVMSQYMQREAMAAGIDAKKLVVNPYFIEDLPSPPTAQPSGNSILYMGRLHESKGVHYLLQAFAQIKTSLAPAPTLEIIGSGSNEEGLQAQCRRLGIADRVFFRGWQSRSAIDAALAACDVVAVPSIYPEAFGIVGIEAMIHAKPVVAFNVGGISDWLRNEETGFLVPAKDSATFAHGLSRLLSDASLYRRMSARARQVALQEYLPKNHLVKLISTYEAALI